MTNQRHQLSGCHEECDCVNKSEQSENDESGQPIGISAHEKFLDDIFVIHPRRYSIYKHVSSRGPKDAEGSPKCARYYARYTKCNSKVSVFLRDSSLSTGMTTRRIQFRF